MHVDQALRLWHGVTLDLVQDERPDLSARQIAILLTVYLDPSPHTVRGLAGTLGVTKPVITRALDTMGKLGLMARRRDEADRRNVVVQRTREGENFVERLGTLLARQAGRIGPEEAPARAAARAAQPREGAALRS